MEYEVRFYFPSEEYDNIIQKLSKIGDLKKRIRDTKKRHSLIILVMI